jgi:hypothetical protein
VVESFFAARPSRPNTFLNTLRPVRHYDNTSDSSTHRDCASILERLQAGTMPCDGAWPEERIDAFRRWVESGKAA